MAHRGSSEACPPFRASYTGPGSLSCLCPSRGFSSACSSSLNDLSPSHSGSRTSHQLLVLRLVLPQYRSPPTMFIPRPHASMILLARDRNPLASGEIRGSETPPSLSRDSPRGHVAPGTLGWKRAQDSGSGPRLETREGGLPSSSFPLPDFSLFLL